jgi:2-hydroxymuconate-semialdehyde hydrolase
MKSNYLMVGDIKTHYIEAGEGNNHLILLHGGEYGGSALHSWEYNIEAFAEHFHVYAVDMIGYGGTDKVVDFNDKGLMRLNHIKKFMEVLCIDNASFVGNSVGGGFILKVASMDKPLWNINKAITISGGGPMNSEAFNVLINYDCTKEYMKKIHDLLFYDEKWKTDEYIEKRYQSSIQPGAWEALSAARFRSPVAKSSGGAVPLDYSEEYKNIKSPVLICTGKYDTLKREDYSDKLSELIPNSQVVLFDNTCHNAQIEQAEEFNKLAIEFLLNK